MIRVIAVVDGEHEDFLEEWFWAREAQAVERKPNHARLREVIALFDDSSNPKIQNELKKSLEDFPGVIHSLGFERVDPQAWQEKWRESFQPLKVGGFTIVGEWLETAADRFTLRVYPGQAFGTGQHQTTQLMITRMEALDLHGKRVLDVGCGTGILAIAAERLGAAEVFGFDIDPDCKQNMARHLAINPTENVSLAIGELDDFQLQPCDLILANLTIDVLASLWTRLADLLVPGGWLLCSGILDHQKATALAGIDAAGLEVVEVYRDGEWLLVEARKP